MPAPIYRKPDLNAPRFRRKKTHLLNSGFFRWLRDQNPGLTLSDNEIREIVRAFNTEQYRTIIREKDGVELMHQLGWIFIGSCPRKKGNNPDRKKSEELGFMIQHNNFGSSQWLQKIFYTNWGPKYAFRNHDMWYMESTLFCRELRREAAANYPKEYKKYTIINGFKYVSNLIKDSPLLDSEADCEDCE